MQRPVFEMGAAYRAARPSYPRALVERVIAWASDGRPAGGVAVDLGCGTGQVAVQLAGAFGEVVGVDSSSSQIAAAEAAPGVRYEIGEAVAALDARAPGSVDLVTIAQTAHWLPAAPLEAALRRVLKPGTGAAAVWGYGLMRFETLHPGADADADAANALLRTYHFERMAPYWAPGRDLLDAGLPHLSSLGCCVHVREHFDMPHEFPSVAVVREYLSTWSCLAEFRRRHAADPAALFPLDELWADLGPLLERICRDAKSGADGLGAVAVLFPVTMILAKNPVPL